MLFNQQLYLFLVDKIVMALLLLVAGFMFSRALEGFKAELALTLEGFKAELALKAELVKQRVGPIAETWRAYWEADKMQKEFLREVSEVEVKNASDNKARVAALKALMPLAEQLKKQFDDFDKVLTANRFWLGRPRYERMTKYKGLLYDLQKAYGERDLKRFMQIEKKLDAVRGSIEDDDLLKL